MSRPCLCPPRASLLAAVLVALLLPGVGGCASHFPRDPGPKASVRCQIGHYHEGHRLKRRSRERFAIAGTIAGFFGAATFFGGYGFLPGVFIPLTVARGADVLHARAATEDWQVHYCGAARRRSGPPE